MVDLTGIGTVIGGLGSLFGGDDGPDPFQQSYGAVRGAIRAGEKSGLYPLASIGGAQGYSPTAGRSDAERIGGLGDSLDRLRQQKQDKETRAKEAELIDAQIAEARSRTILNVSNARRAGATGPSGVTGVSGGLAMDRAPGGGPRPTSLEPQRDMPARQRVSLGDQTGTGPNPEAFEVGLSELLAGALIYGPQWLYGRYRDRADEFNSRAPNWKYPNTEPEPFYVPDYAAP